MSDGTTQFCPRCVEKDTEIERLRAGLVFDYDTIYGVDGIPGRWHEIHDWLAAAYGLDMIRSSDSELNLGYAREVITIVVEGFLATLTAAPTEEPQ